MGSGAPPARLRPHLVVTSHGSDGKLRIISARRATKRERHVYENL
jgi:uncharacterized DUF497 family protein